MLLLANLHILKEPPAINSKEEHHKPGYAKRQPWAADLTQQTSQLQTLIYSKAAFGSPPCTT